MTYWKKISRDETAFIKGFGMLLILFHNYSHFITPWSGENEFVFSYHYTTAFLTLVVQNPFDIIRLLFAFFGHYGVQLFIFISGYGLFLSYKDKAVKWSRFFKKHLLKLYPTLFLAVGLILILHSISYRGLPPIHEIKLAIIDLLFLQNFIPGLVYELTGPWWFFSLIVQLYAVFPCILILFRKFGIKAVIGVGIFSWLVTLIFNPLLTQWQYNLYYLFIGRLPVFCLGILLAWLGSFRLPSWLILLSFILIIGGNLSSLLWPFTMLAVTMFLVVVIRQTIRAMKNSGTFAFFISWVGMNSLFIFAVHGFLRMPFVIRAEKWNNPLITIGLGLAYLGVSLLVALILKILENKIQEYIIQPYFFGDRTFRSSSVHEA